MKNPLISIIVPNYQGKDVFPKCIDSLLKQTYDNLQIVFVDDSSKDGSFDLAKKLYSTNKTIIVTKTLINSGYTGACNHGLTKCTGSYVIVTNNDATFPSNWIQEMYNIVKRKRKVIGASIIVEPGTKCWRDGIKKGKFLAFSLVGTYVSRELSADEKKSKLMELFAAGVLIIPRDAIHEELFLQDYFAYCEDIELCWRLRMQEYHIVMNDRARMQHIGSYTKKNVKGFSKRSAMNGTKNRLINFLTLYEKKNIIRILPPYMVVELGAFLSQPRLMGARLRGYWWILTHPKRILKQRKDRQQSRTLPDKELLGMLSYKLLEEEYIRAYARPIAKFANSTMKVYCKIVGLKTFDISNKNAIPAINKLAIKKRL